MKRLDSCLQSVHAIPTSQHRFRRERPTETVYRIVIANLKRSLATPCNQLHAMLDNFKAVFNLALKDEIKLTLTKVRILMNMLNLLVAILH